METKGAKGAQTRQAVLEAAITRFGRDGYRATSVADIARDAGVGGTVAYAYFPNKEALFLAALDEDAAAVIRDGVSTVLDDPGPVDWRQSLVLTLLGAVSDHPLARRVLAGLEPDVTDRVLEIPALSDLRKAVAERLHRDQMAGDMRDDVDAATIANGVVTITLSLLMSLVQFGTGAAAAYGADVVAVLAAAMSPPGLSARRRRTGRPSRRQQ